MRSPFLNFRFQTVFVANYKTLYSHTVRGDVSKWAT